MRFLIRVSGYTTSLSASCLAADSSRCNRDQDQDVRPNDLTPRLIYVEPTF